MALKESTWRWWLGVGKRNEWKEKKEKGDDGIGKNKKG